MVPDSSRKIRIGRGELLRAPNFQPIGKQRVCGSFLDFRIGRIYHERGIWRRFCKYRYRFTESFVLASHYLIRLSYRP